MNFFSNFFTMAAGISPLLCLSKPHPLFPVLTSLSVFTASTVGIICESLAGGGGAELNERISKENTRSSITGSPAKLTNGSKSSLNSRASIEIDAEISTSLSSATSRQTTTSGENP
ncbi:hypothetical protein AYI68_g525 [Smittium mucronatum]|uniref:Uncharacterized protein n=1 Tax=Smittium mucronatum TaxID=133383 RepID=A0A1R0H832_9FUNG|nr:hypothetical protein AYI68_g525 [Smittium mucronatum]